MATVTLLRIDALAVRHGARQALAPVSLAVGGGEIVALVGASGSGKSTLALAVLGLLPPGAVATGRVAVDGRDLATLDARGWRRLRGGRIGLVFQEPATALDPLMPVGRQIGEVLTAHGWRGRRAIAAEVAALLARVGLDLSTSRRPHQMSGGQRQRAQIAIAIAARPALLIADEPTAALDPAAAAGVAALLARLAREEGMGLLLISHDAALVSGLADRVVTIGPPPSVAAAAAPSPVIVGAPLLEVRAAGRRHLADRWAVRGVSFALAEGETLAVVGGSGGGKSTLARLVLGLDRPDEGQVTLDGRPATRARGVAQAVFQDPATSFDPRWTVGRIVAEPLDDAGLSRAEVAARVAAALAEVDLPADAATRRASAFSGGQRQRIALARALIVPPRLLVLDEALSALDAPAQERMLALIARHRAAHPMALLFISHDPAMVSRVAKRVLVLEEGRVAA